MKIVKLFDDFLDINANMLGMSRQEYTSRYLSEMVEYTSDELSKIWDSKYGEDLKSEHSGFFNKISKSASTKKEIVYFFNDQIICFFSHVIFSLFIISMTRYFNLS